MADTASITRRSALASVAAVALTPLTASPKISEPGARKTGPGQTARIKALKSTAAPTKRVTASPVRFDLASWLAGYEAGMRGDPGCEVPRGMHGTSWKAGHLQRHKHEVLHEAMEAAVAARHHGGEVLAEVADKIASKLGAVGHPQYIHGFKAGFEAGAKMAHPQTRWRRSTRPLSWAA